MILHIRMLAFSNGVTCAGTGMETTYLLMVPEESLPMPFSPGHTEKEKSTLTTMSTGQWETMWVCAS